MRYQVYLTTSGIADRQPFASFKKLNDGVSYIAYLGSKHADKPMFYYVLTEENGNILLASTECDQGREYRLASSRLSVEL